MKLQDIRRPVAAISIAAASILILISVPGKLLAGAGADDNGQGSVEESFRNAVGTAMSSQPTLPTIIGDFNAQLRSIGYQLSSLILAPSAAGDAGLRARSLPPESIELEVCSHVIAPRPTDRTTNDQPSSDDIWTCFILGN